MTRNLISKTIRDVGGYYVIDVGLTEHYKGGTATPTIPRWKMFIMDLLRLKVTRSPGHRLEVIIMGRPGFVEERAEAIIEALELLRPAGVVFQVRAFIEGREVFQ